MGSQFSGLVPHIGIFSGFCVVVKDDLSLAVSLTTTQKVLWWLKFSLASGSNIGSTATNRMHYCKANLFMV